MKLGVAIGLVLGAAAALFAGGYAVGKSQASSQRDVTDARVGAKRAALGRVRAENRRMLEAIRTEAGESAARRGRQAGTVAGREAGLREIAARGAGPTPLPRPVLPTDLVRRPTPTGFKARPTEVLIGKYVRLEDISWSTWGETAQGTGTLIGNDCKPACVAGSETRERASLTATRPQFSVKNSYYFTKLRVSPAKQRAFTVDINAEGAPAG
ncbi:MAG: hypothetical protein M3433_03155 [Actinomycetota bacterium]|nr:hypothetical protein [Actinomycetota bacterium]